MTIKTGRLHQIRAHMMFLNCQVMGDDLYVPPAVEGAEVVKQHDLPRALRLCLHAFHLGFKHPISNKWVHFYSELPGDLARFAAKLGLMVPALPQGEVKTKD